MYDYDHTRLCMTVSETQGLCMQRISRQSRYLRTCATKENLTNGWSQTDLQLLNRVPLKSQENDHIMGNNNQKWGARL